MASRTRARINNLNDRAREVGAAGVLTLDDIDALKAFYDFTCLKCGARPAISPDHVKPLATGGENTVENLQLLCEKCNKGKGDTEQDYRNGKVLTVADVAAFKEKQFQEKYGDLVKEKAQRYFEIWKESQSRIKPLPYSTGENSTVDLMLGILAESPSEDSTKIAVHNKIVTAYRFLNKQTKRPYIPDSSRERVYALTDGFCFYCGSFLPQDNWHVDHMIPFSKGGSSELTNLVPACVNCNTKKSDKMPNDQAIVKFSRLFSQLASFQATGK